MSVAFADAGSAPAAEAREDIRFEPIRQVRAHEYVAEQIRRHISLRLIPPGKALPPERRLADQFGVGRPTIQLALRVLEAERLIEARRGARGGTFVCRPADDEHVKDELIARIARQHKEIEELLVYRGAIEPQATRLAAAARHQVHLKAMRRAIGAAARAASEPEYMRHDTEFHLAVAAATRNRFLERAIEETRRGLNDVMSLLPESQVWHTRIDREHRELVEAIEARDADAAERSMALHVVGTDQGVRAVLAAIRRRVPADRGPVGGGRLSGAPA